MLWKLLQVVAENIKKHLSRFRTEITAKKPDVDLT